MLQVCQLKRSGVSAVAARAPNDGIIKSTSTTRGISSERASYASAIRFIHRASSGRLDSRRRAICKHKTHDELSRPCFCSSLTGPDPGCVPAWTRFPRPAIRAIVVFCWDVILDADDQKHVEMQEYRRKRMSREEEGWWPCGSSPDWLALGCLDGRCPPPSCTTNVRPAGRRTQTEGKPECRDFLHVVRSLINTSLYLFLARLLPLHLPRNAPHSSVHYPLFATQST